MNDLPTSTAPTDAADQPATAVLSDGSDDSRTLVPTTPALTLVPTTPVVSPLNVLRSELQPIAHRLLADEAYWEQLKRTASPRTFLEFVRFAFAADLEGRPGSALNQQFVIHAPFPKGPLDELPPGFRTG